MPARPCDIDILFEWRNDPLWLAYCTRRPSIENSFEFIAEIKRDFSRDRWLQFLVIKPDGSRAGTVYSYRYSGIDRSTYATVFIGRRDRGKGLGVRSFILLCCYLEGLADRKIEEVRIEVKEQNHYMRALLREIIATTLVVSVEVRVNGNIDVRFCVSECAKIGYSYFNAARFTPEEI